MRDRTIKFDPSFSGVESNVHVEIHSRGKHSWLTIKAGNNFIGSISSTTKLRRLADSINEALPPKRGEK